MTQHGVFDYLARNLKLPVFATITSEPESGITASEMTALAAKLKGKNIDAIYTEPQYSSRVAQTIARECGIPLASLDPVANGPADAHPPHPALGEIEREAPLLQVRGLMTIPPVEEQPGEARRWFAAMRRLFDEAADRWKGDSRVRMEMLSMGMSGDFEQAIAEGATLVRVGTAIFGPRVYKV